MTESWHRREDTVLMVCGRCSSGAGEQWALDLRKEVYDLLGKQARATVTVTGCLRYCPRDRVAVVVAGAGRHCLEMATEPGSDTQRAALTALLTHPSAARPQPVDPG